MGAVKAWAPGLTEKEIEEQFKNTITHRCLHTYIAYIRLYIKHVYTVYTHIHTHTLI